MRFLLPLLALTAACSVTSSANDDDSASNESNQTAEARVELTKDFKTNLSGKVRAGTALTIDYSLDRLPQCRGNVGGGGPAWNIFGFFSENGGAAKSFEVTQLTPDGKDRASKPARITPTSGGDLSIWFQVTSSFGCSEFDSSFGNNYHFQVEGPPPSAAASIRFDKSGEPVLEGQLKAGGKVKVRYEQDRLPQCRRSQGGFPQWAISGAASFNGKKATPFETGRPNGSDREEIDAIIALPEAGDLALFFEVTSVGGCHEFDSKGGANYHFKIE